MFGSFACNFEEEYRGLGSVLFLPNSWQTHRLLFGDRLPGVLLQPLLYTGFESWKADQLRATSIQLDQQRGKAPAVQESLTAACQYPVLYVLLPLFKISVRQRWEVCLWSLNWTHFITVTGAGGLCKGPLSRNCRGNVSVLSRYYLGAVLLLW